MDIRISAVESEMLCFEVSGIKVWADEAQIVKGSLHLYKDGGVVAVFDLFKLSERGE
jgi:hypothetical protein